MNNLVIMKDHTAVTTSLQVADTFNKNHRDVLKAVDELKEGVAQKFADLFWEDLYIHPQNKQSYRLIYMTRDGFTLLAMGFTGKKALDFKLKYIEAFNEMDNVIRKSTVPTRIEDMMIYQLEEMKEVKDDVSMLKDTMRISGQQEFEINQKGKLKVVEVLGGKKSRAYEVIGKRVFARFWSDFKRMFLVPRYGELPKVKFDEALRYIEMWMPETATRMEIEQLNRQQELFEGDLYE